MNPSPAVHRPPAEAYEARHGAADCRQDLLVFQLGSTSYGLPLLQVQELRTYVPPTPVASSPDFLKGLLDLRGTVVPVLCLRRCLGLPAQAVEQHCITVVVHAGQHRVGLMVDAVSEVQSLLPGQVRPAPPLAHGAASSFIAGICTLDRASDRDLLLLLDLDSLLSHTLPSLAAPRLQA